MKKNKNNIERKMTKHDKGQIFVKVMAGVLAILMMGGTLTTLVYALM